MNSGEPDDYRLRRNTLLNDFRDSTLIFVDTGDFSSHSSILYLG